MTPKEERIPTRDAIIVAKWGISQENVTLPAMMKVAPVEVTVVVPAVVHALRTLSAQKRTNADTEAIAAIEDVVVHQNPKNSARIDRKTETKRERKNTREATLPPELMDDQE